MMREQLDSERIRGADAKTLIENPLLKEAFAEAEKSILSQMDDVSMRDSDMHTRLILARKVLNSVKSYIHRVIQTGEIADLQINEPNKFAKLFRK